MEIFSQILIGNIQVCIGPLDSFGMFFFGGGRGCLNPYYLILLEREHIWLQISTEKILQQTEKKPQQNSITIFNLLLNFYRKISHLKR